MSKNQKNVVIFDFDGTLADVVPLMRQIYNDFALKKGYPHLSEENFQELRKGTLKDFLKWIGVKPWQLPGLMKEGRAVFHVQSEDVRLFDGVTNLITKLHNDGWHIYILSSNSNKTIHEVLTRNGINDYIKILKRPSLFGKANSIKKLVKKHRYEKSNTWMIGDEVRDIDAGNKAKINTIGVTWGLQDESIIVDHNPNFMANTIDDIYKALANS